MSVLLSLCLWEALGLRPVHPHYTASLIPAHYSEWWTISFGSDGLGRAVRPRVSLEYVSLTAAVRCSQIINRRAEYLLTVVGISHLNHVQSHHSFTSLIGQLGYSWNLFLRCPVRFQLGLFIYTYKIRWLVQTRARYVNRIDSALI